MTLETNQEVGNPEHDPMVNPWYVHGPIAAFLLALLLERGITVLFWRLESNPLVTELGVIPWIVLTITLVAAVLFIWYPGMGVKQKANRYLVWGLAAFHYLAAISNIAVVVF